MGPPELAAAIFALLLTPGPTNTLLFLAGTERGFPRVLRLIPAELAGYLATVVPLTLAGAALLSRFPEARPAIALAAGLWVAWLAIRLWRLPSAGPSGSGSVTARDVFVTTLLNPKALIFGLVLLPAPSVTGILANLGQFAAQVVIVAMLWAGGGALVAARTGGTRSVILLRRAAAVWLGVVSATLLARALGAA
ncbi:LysE family translocator [Neotabrizicola shimadae]|uniref:LysE family translocator n=1 Tax=Neotabrizicola shimadae TaxID=2807096 RepID=A0A8G1ED40_9RHOB|nr:hypothetical protein [Neotabrizicola shimadae]QYZ71275.1 hypothetical protein JO391_07155 [Neotabrizicola shimadae]